MNLVWILMAIFGFELDPQTFARGIDPGSRSTCKEYDARVRSELPLRSDPLPAEGTFLKIFENDSMRIEIERSEASAIGIDQDSSGTPLFASLPILSYRSNRFALVKAVAMLMEDRRVWIFDKARGEFLNSVRKIRLIDHLCPPATFHADRYYLNDALLLDLTELTSS